MNPSANVMRRGVEIFALGLSLAFASVAFSSESSEGTNLFLHGDAADGVIPFTVNEDNMSAALFQGDPSGGEEKASFEVVLKKDISQTSGTPVSFSCPKMLFDNEQVYHISMKVFSPDDVTVIPGGYSFAATSGNPLTEGPDSKRVWGYSLRPQDGSNNFQISGSSGWQVFETTVGPKDSAARYQWSDDATSLSFTVWLKGAQGSKIYFNDFRMEPVTAE